MPNNIIKCQNSLTFLKFDVFKMPFECPKLKFLNAIRLSIAFYEEEDLIKGAERLCQALRNFIGPEVACSESSLVEK